MSQVISNPEELRALAQVLRQCTSTIMESMGQMNGAVAGCSWWNDVKKTEFETVLAELNQQIASFHESVQDQIVHLHALASQLDDYIST